MGIVTTTIGFVEWEANSRKQGGKGKGREKGSDESKIEEWDVEVGDDGGEREKRAS